MATASAALLLGLTVVPFGVATPSVAVEAKPQADCTVIGTQDDDVLRGGPGRDVICALGGDDTLVGRGGDDVLRGGPGNDRLRGDAGDDRLQGGAGKDQLTGGPGDDRLGGGAGNDALRGRDGASSRDVLRCGPGGADAAEADMPDLVGSSCEDVDRNDPPTGVVLTPHSVRENRPAGTAVGQLSADDPDPGDRHRFALVAGPGGDDNASFAIVGKTLRTAASLDFEADAERSVRVQVTDAEGATFQQALAVSVEDVSENPPVANDDDASTDEDTTLTMSVSGPGSPAANDSDADGDPLTVTAVSGATGGTVSISAGTISFVPAPDLCGADAGHFDYTVSDGTGATDTGLVTVDITCVGDAPTAAADTATVAEDAAATAVDVLGNDSDAESDPFSIASATDPAHGTVVLTPGSPPHTGLTYTPDPDYCSTGGAPDQLTYTLTPGGDSATVDVTVTCVDDDPVADPDTATVSEDSAATAVDVLANDSDADSGDADPSTVAAVTIVSTDQPADGTVVLTGPVGARTGLTYQPDADYCNDPGAPGDDTFTYTVNGGDTATVSVVVTCVDDDPGAVDDATSVLMDSTATAVDVLANDANADSGPMAIASASDPAHGTVALTGGTPGNHTGLSYEPDPGYCNTDNADPDDTFTYTLTPGGDTATVSVEVTCDVPPVAVDDTATVAEDAAATAVDVLGNDTDTDGGPMNVASASQPAHGTVVLTGPVGARTGLTYEPDADYCNTDGADPDDTFTYTLNGGDVGAVAVTVTCVDDDPTAVADAATVDEDSSATTVLVLANDTDADGGPVQVASVSQPDHGTATDDDTHVTYTPDPDYCNDPPGGAPDTFTYTLNGGSQATVSVTVTCLPDAPTVDNSAGTTSYTENAVPVAVDPAVGIVNPDGLPITAGSVAITAGGTGPDALDWNDNDGGDGITEGASTATSVLLTGTGTAAEYEAALAAVTFANSSDTPTAAARTVTFTVTTSAGSPTDTKQVVVVPVDDPPTADDDAATVVEDAAATAVPVLTNDDDIDGGPMTIASASDPAHGTVVLTGPVGARTGLTYQPDPDYCNDPHANPEDTFTYTLSPGSDQGTVAMTVTCVNDAPVADDDPFGDALGNTRFVVGTTSTGPRLTVAGDVLTGDTDVDTPLASLTAGPGTITSTQCTGVCAGNVTMEPDGQFTYDPRPGFTGTDTFTYTVSDNDAQAPANQSDTGTVTITVVGPVVWYVEGDAASAGDGRSHSPANTLSALSTGGALDALDGSGDVVFVYDAASPYAGGLVLEANQSLIGQPHSLDVDPAGATPLQTDLVAAGGSNPLVVNAGGNALTLASGNTIQGVNLGSTPAANASLAGTSIGTATVNTVTTGSINNTTGKAVDVTTGTLNATLSSVSSGGGTAGIALNGVDGTFTGNGGTLAGATVAAVDINAGSGAFSYAGTVGNGSGLSVEVTNRTGGSVTLSGAVTDTGDAGGGVNLTGNTVGSTISFTGGSLDVSTGGDTGFNATGGTVTVTGSSNSIVTTTGTALNVSGATIGANDLTFESVSAGTGAGSAGLGINLVNTGSSGGLHVTGAGTAGSGGTIQHKTGADGSTTGGIGVFLQNTSDVQLARMALHDFDNYAIRGLGVDGFTLASSVVNGTNGTSTAVDEGAVVFGVRAGTTGLTGTASVTGTTISGGVEDNLGVYNTSGTVNLTVSGSTITNAGNDGLAVELHTSATANVGVQGSTFTDNIGDHINTTANGAANLNVQAGNTSANTLSTSAGAYASVLGGSFVVQTAGQWSGTGSANISNNTITFAKDTPLNVNIGGTGTFGATLNNNTIGMSGVANSGSAGNEDAIRIVANGDKGALGAGANGGTLNALVTNNVVQQVSGRGIFVIGRDGGSAGDPIQLNVTIQGNLLRESPSSGGQGIRLESGASSTPTPDHVTLHANIGGPGGLANVFPDNWGSNLPSGTDFHEIRITHNITGGNRFILTGYAGGGTDTSAVAAYLAGRNTLPGGGTASATVGGGNSYENGGNPPTP